MPELVLTRPAAQAAEWAQQLARLGVPTRVRPLITTAALPAAQATARAAAQQADWVFFTSTAAVDALFGEGWRWPSQARALCVGPGTAAALTAAGVAKVLCPAPEAPQFDSEALWPLLQAALKPGDRVLWLRGDGGRDWLIEQLRHAGATVETLSIYARSAPRLTPNELDQLQAWLQEPLLWLFSSGEAVGHLDALTAVPWSSLRALATHPRIAQRLAEFGCHAQVLPPRPEDVAQAWKAAS